MRRLLVTADVHGSHTAWLILKSLLKPDDILVVAGDLFDTRYGSWADNDFKPDALKEGLKDLFDEISPISDFIGRDLELYFENYYLDEPKFNEPESKNKNVTYEAPLRVTVKLVNKRTGQTTSQEVFLGDFPLMTKNGTFIVNGIERVVVSQLIRSSGVIFTSEFVKGKKEETKPEQEA